MKYKKQFKVVMAKGILFFVSLKMPKRLVYAFIHRCPWLEKKMFKIYFSKKRVPVSDNHSLESYSQDAIEIYHRLVRANQEKGKELAD